MSNVIPKISVDYLDGAVVVELLEEKILDQTQINALSDSIFPVIEQNEKINLILDFSNVKFLSSSVLGLLIRISKKVYETAGQLCLCRIDQKIDEIFKITRLDQVFTIMPDKESAIESIKEQQ